mmetsp:Transcript_108070/g.345131  ORF Transcript_108070/g.345131 Transcript_108070/m.345131 type:complete len:260 (-) Transcript_108070:48-827(-)
MYFANASFIKDVLLTYVEDLKEVNETEYIVLEMTPVISLDSTAVHVIQDLVHDFRSRGIQVAFAMVGNRVEKTMRNAKVTDFIGSQWFFPTVNQAVAFCVQHQLNKRVQQSTQTLSLRSETSVPDVEFGDIPNPNPVQMLPASSEIGFSNDLNHSGTTVFISLTPDIPMIMNGFATVFHKNHLSTLKVNMEIANDSISGAKGARFTYVVRSMNTGAKLADEEIVSVRDEVQEAIRRAQDDALNPVVVPASGAAVMPLCA